MGGVREEDGELAAMGYPKVYPGLLNNKTGMSHDYARELLVEHGYLPPGSDVTDFRSLLSEASSGRHVIRPDQDVFELQASQGKEAASRNAAEMLRARNAIVSLEDEMGLRMSREEVEHAADLHAQGMHPEEAIRQAVSAGENGALDTLAQKRAFTGEGLPGATQGELDGVTRERSVPEATYDARAHEARGIAQASHAENKQTYTNKLSAPGVAHVLERGPVAGTWKVPDSAVPGQLFTAGNAAPERIRAFVKAGGDINTLQDYAAYSLRDAAEENGALNLNEYQKWREKHADALQALEQTAGPALRQRMDTAAGASQVLSDLRAQRAGLDAAYPIKPGWNNNAVMEQFVKPGDKGAEAAKALKNATGNTPETHATVSDYMAHVLRDKFRAVAADGTLDPKAYARFMRQYEPFLSQFPEVAEKFRTAGEAQRTLSDALDAHAAAREDLLNSVAQHFMGDADPVTKMTQMLKSSTAVAQVRDLAARTRGDTVGTDAVKSAIVQSIQREMRSVAKAGATGENEVRPGMATKFLDKIAPAVRQIMTPDEMATLTNAAGKVEKLIQVASGAKLKGGSDTAQLSSGHHEDTALSQFMLFELGSEAMEHVAGGAGKALTFGPLLAMKWREHQMGKVDRLEAAMYLNPSLFHALASKIPASKPAQNILANRIVNLGIASMNGSQPRKRP
jgi:hypothetical protein